MSRVNEKIATLATKVEDILTRVHSNPDGVVSDQSEIDAIEARLDDILARIP